MRVSEKTIQQYQLFLFAESIGKFYLDERRNPTSSESFEETGTSPSTEKKLPRERCKVNLLEISRTRRICRNYRLLGKHADKVRGATLIDRWENVAGAIVLHSFLETRVVTSPCPSSPSPPRPSRHSILLSFLFFDPFRGLATEEKVIFERRNFYEPTAESQGMCVFKSAVHK